MTKHMSLAGVTRGKVRKPVRAVLYGVDKIGKSTFGAGAPSPIFIGAEDGTSELDVARFPEPRSWVDIIEGIQVLIDGGHDYKTLVIDTLDWAEPLVWRFICEREGKSSIEAFGYGKGYGIALDEWRGLLARLDVLRAKRGMSIVLLAHAWIKGFANPAGDDYDRFEMKLHKQSSALVKEWADAVLFATYETFTKKKGDAPNAKSRGVSSGARIIHTTRCAAWDAGNRYGLPETLPLSWADFEEAVRAGSPSDPEALRATIAELLPQVPLDVRTKAEAWMQGNIADPIKLSQLADRLRAKVAINETKEGVTT